MSFLIFLSFRLLCFSFSFSSKKLLCIFGCCFKSFYFCTRFARETRLEVWHSDAFWALVMPLKKTFQKVWLVSEKVLIFASAFLEKGSLAWMPRQFFDILINNTSSTIILNRQYSCRLLYRGRFRYFFLRLRVDKSYGILNRAMIIFQVFRFFWFDLNVRILLQWRVWSWLRMNASYRLNTCKSRGSMGLAC